MVKQKVHKVFDRKELVKKLEVLHPHQLLMYVAMIGSGTIFLFMLVAFAVSKPELSDFEWFQFPKLFVVSTLVLLLSGFSVSKILPAYQKDDIDGLKKWLGITFLLGLIFSASQFLGWNELQASGVLFAGERSGAYLYVVSGLHMVHVAGGMFFLLKALLGCHTVSKDAVKRLIYMTNPYQKVKLKILRDFWHFMDIVWVLLFLYFFFSF